MYVTKIELESYKGEFKWHISQISNSSIAEPGFFNEPLLL